MRRLGIVVVVLFAMSARAQQRPSEAWPNLAHLGSPVGGGEKDAAVVVGLEDYAFAPKIPGAAENAADWVRYFTHVRKTPLARVHYLPNNDGTVEKMRKHVAEAARQVERDGTLWFVFIGHGAPAADGKGGILVGVDAQQDPDSLYARSLPQPELLAILRRGAQRRTLLVLDACFSGRTGTGAPIAPGLQPLILVKRSVPPPGATILTAGTADQFSGPLPRANRPAFSYLVLGAMYGWGDKNGDGKVTVREATDYAADALRSLVRGRSQTPEASGRDLEILSHGQAAPAPDLVELALADGARTATPEPPATPQPVRGGPAIAPAAAPSLTPTPPIQASCGPDCTQWVAKCNAGDSEGCALAAMSFTLGNNGATKDESLAIAFHRKNCESHGEMLGCMMLASLLKKSDPEGEQRYAQRACDGGLPVSCFSVSVKPSSKAYGVGQLVAMCDGRKAAYLGKHPERFKQSPLVVGRAAACHYLKSADPSRASQASAAIDGLCRAGDNAACQISYMR